MWGAAGGAGGVPSVAGLGGAFGQAAQQQAHAEIQQMCLEVKTRMEQLQAAHARDFIAYSYTVCGDPQTLLAARAQAFNSELHGDPVKWQEAKDNNPAPNICYAEPLHGFSALVSRAQKQEQALAQEEQMLESIQKEAAQLMSQVDVTVQRKMRDCQKRHLQLQHQVVALMSHLEAHAVTCGTARRDLQAEAALDGQYEELEAAVQPTRGEARLAELACVLRALAAGHMEGSERHNALPLGPQGEQRVLSVLDKQHALLDDLVIEAARLTEAATALQQHLGQPGAAPAAPAQAGLLLPR